MTELGALPKEASCNAPLRGKEIDNLVYLPYGLTQEEIKTIEGKTGIQSR